MPNILNIIGQSWDFCRKQPAMMQVMFWLLFLPFLGMMLLTDAEEQFAASLDTNMEANVVLVLANIGLTLLVMWGTVSVLSIGKRMLHAKSGRTRTSFKTVRSQSAGSFIPFLLTSILRGIFTFLWTLLLIIPGIVYMVRTAFYSVIVVCEGVQYRAALQKSKDVVRDKFWPVFWSLLTLQLLTIVPAQILTIVFSLMAEEAPPVILVSAGTASAVIFAFATALNLLSLIQIYGYFRPSTSPVFR